MKPIKEIYDYTGSGNYGPLLESIGQIIVEIDDSDYQGSSRVLYKQDDKYGVLLFGWGSCSGCDSLQACDTYEEMEDLRNDLINRIKWGTKEEIVAHLTGKDWEVEATYRPNETHKFVEQCMKVLGD